jgi:hypothetical protein
VEWPQDHEVCGTPTLFAFFVVRGRALIIAIDDAMNTVEYVPLMMPTSIAKAKPDSTSPPNR